MRPAATGGGQVDEAPDVDYLVAHIRVPEHVVHRHFDGETVLLNLQTGTYHGLNATGGRMLQLLEDSGSLRLVAETVARERHHPVDDVVRDLTRLCASLAARGLIEVDGNAVG